MGGGSLALSELVREVRRIGGGGRGALGGLFLCLVLAGWLASALGPVAPGSTAYRLVRVPPRATAAWIGGQLARRGIIASPLAFRVLADLQGVGGKLQAGVYRLGPGQSPRQILALLAAGRVYTERVTIPEGSTVGEIATLLAQHGITGRHGFLQAAQGSYGLTFLRPTPAGVRYRLEGYLFPATYRFSPGEPATQVAAAMVARYRQAFTATDATRAAAQGLTESQVVILASIVQQEAKPASFSQVAAVFLNRLRLHMPLDANATVNYVLATPQAWLSPKALADPSPYNTYLHPGLPPGPICSPGEAAIRAVLHPARVGYLYFLTIPGGRTLFSNTYQEQLALVRRYAPKAG